MKGRGLKPNQTRDKNGGSALRVLRQSGGYRINKDGSISSASEVLNERKNMERQKALDLTKTIFGLATGRIRHESGEIITAANGIQAFSELPQAIADGSFGRLQSDYTNRADYKLLAKHITDDNPLVYVKTLGKEEVELLADYSETFFTAIVYEKGVIPMSDSEKKRVIEVLATKH